MVNLFGTKPVLDPGEELILTSRTPLTIPAMLAQTSARFGDKVAYQQKIAGEWQRLTFEQTWRRANDFAAGLIAMGLQKGDRVAIICENGASWAIGYFGLSLAGGVGVPLYTELKPAEIEGLVERAGARFIIASEKLLDRLGDHPAHVEKVIVVGGSEARPGKPPRFLRHGRPDLIPFDDVPARATDESHAELDSRQVEPDDLASIVFTSGTTGGMKGVMLTHKNLMANAESSRRQVQVDDHDRLLIVLPLHHAFPFILFLTGSSVGGEITFENDLLRVRDRLAEVKPTLFLGVPALFEQMYRTILRRAETEGRLELFERGLRIVDVAKRRIGVNLGRFIFREVHQLLGGNLRFALSGGAALRPELALNFFRLGLPLLQGWGLTEAAPVVAGQDWVPRKFMFSNYYEEHTGSVGTPVDGVEVKLIDVPEKEIYVHLHGEGELIVRGPNVFAGYWQAPKETSDAMAGDWLRTGDLGRIDEEGNIWITGRSKYVIVLDSGEKVVPDELEDRLLESDVIGDACVLPRSARNKTHVGAVIYPSVEGVQANLEEQHESFTEEAVRKLVQAEVDAVSHSLAQFKRISEVILTDTPLPKTALQKIARGNLADSYSFDIARWEHSAPDPLVPDTNEDETAPEPEDS